MQLTALKCNFLTFFLQQKLALLITFPLVGVNNHGAGTKRHLCPLLPHDVVPS